ncbi:MAG: SRPBCC family protein [Gallionellaceae bacterium]|nr:SRPBCC family protein [Gallionellaceae bacterium]
MNPFDPQLDLSFERIVDVPRELVWKAWTEPRYIVQWFTPAPWKTVACEIDLRPGGRFHTVMQSPDGQSFPNTGCYLEVVENRRLVWTNAVSPGFRPAAAPEGDFAMTAIIELAGQDAGTRYTATVLHENRAARAQHAAMHFEEGWGKALDQLVAMVKAW